MDYVMEAASGAHFSGLHLDGLLSSSSQTSSPPPPSSSSSAIITDNNAPKQPFVIGNFDYPFLLHYSKP